MEEENPSKWKPSYRFASERTDMPLQKREACRPDGPFAKDKRELKVRAEGQLAFNTVTLMLDMAVAGLGLVYLPEDLVRTHLAKGRLVRVLRSVKARVHLRPLRSGHRRFPLMAQGYWMLRFRGA